MFQDFLFGLQNIVKLKGILNDSFQFRDCSYMFAMAFFVLFVKEVEEENNNITNQTINVLSAAVANEIKYSPARSQFSRHLAFSSSLFSLSARLFSRASYNSSVNLT
ncbi:hypothetical protein T09_14446 [Trichinella sp. T9]|nr:hypothetical protein T09_14446 [Trichinella sp. T9]